MIAYAIQDRKRLVNEPKSQERASNISKIDNRVGLFVVTSSSLFVKSLFCSAELCHMEAFRPLHASLGRADVTSSSACEIFPLAQISRPMSRLILENEVRHLA